MNYKITAMIAAAAGITASIFSQDFHKKATLATDALTASAEKVKQAENDRREAEESLRGLIRSEGDLSEKDIQRLKDALENRSEELAAARRDANDSEKRWERKANGLPKRLHNWMTLSMDSRW